MLMVESWLIWTVMDHAVWTMCAEVAGRDTAGRDTAGHDTAVLEFALGRGHVHFCEILGP